MDSVITDKYELYQNIQMKSDNTSSCIKSYPESAYKVTDYSLEIKDLPELGTGIISVSCIVKTGIISISGQWLLDDEKMKVYNTFPLLTKHNVKLYRHTDNISVYEGDMSITKVELNLDAYRADGYATMSILFDGV